MHALRRFLALTPGNPMNPVTLLLLAFFTAALVGFPLLTLAVGLGTWDVVVIEAVVVATAVACLGFVVWLARRYARDHDRLLAGEHWVHWRTSPAERGRFLAQEQDRARADARFALGGTVVVALLGAAGMWAYTEEARGAAIGFAVFGAAGLLVALTTRLWGGATARPDAPDPDDTYLGPLGVYQLGRYTPLRGFNLFLQRVDLRPGAPAVLAFTIGSRTRYGSVRTTETRVAVPPGREDEAAELAERFRREFGLDAS